MYLISGLVGILAFLMAAPYISYIIAGLLLAFITRPAYTFLERRMDQRLAAGSVVALTIFAAVIPFTVLAGVVGDDATRVVQDIEAAEGTQIIEELEGFVNSQTGQQIDIMEKLRQTAGSIASYLPSSLSAALDLVAGLAVGVSIMVFAQFYAVKDGYRLVEWTKGFDLITDERQEMLYHSTSESIKAIVKGHVLMAFTQGILAGIGLFIFGIENVLFWTLMMVILGFIPMVGSALVWLPASLFLIATGETVSGLLLLVYGAVVVGGADNFLRPLMVDDSADIHSFFIILGLIGGVGLFGPVGIFIGPVIFGVLKNLLDIIQETH